MINLIEKNQEYQKMLVRKIWYKTQFKSSQMLNLNLKKIRKIGLQNANDICAFLIKKACTFI